MTVLVQKLQNALSSLERFRAVLSHSSRSSSGSARLSSGLSVLSQPFNEFGQKSIVPTGNSKSGTTRAEAGVSFPTTCRHSTRSRSSVNIGDTSRKEITQDKSTSSSKGKGKVVLKPAQEVARGPQTRNATPRRAALDKDAQMKPVNDDFTSKDEDLDISPVEIDKALVIEDDDISDDEDDDHEDLNSIVSILKKLVLVLFLSMQVLRDGSLPVCSPNNIHDVKLGNLAEECNVAPATSDGQTNTALGSSSTASTVRGSDSADFRNDYALSSRGAMSFVVVAMVGLRSTNNRGIKGGRDRLGHSLFGSSNDPPKLIFTASGK
ncbi:hypothetical protein JHK85_001528 [Glycine max]|nr:hypothetical protein JHK85_001528 [Glycine max]